MGKHHDRYLCERSREIFSSVGALPLMVRRRRCVMNSERSFPASCHELIAQETARRVGASLIVSAHEIAPFREVRSIVVQRERSVARGHVIRFGLLHLD